MEIPNGTCAPVTINITTAEGVIKRFPCKEESGLYQVPFFRDAHTLFAGIASHQLRALLDSEIWHLRLCHASAQKIHQLSKNCIGIPKVIAEHRLPCHCCQEANARVQERPGKLDHSEDADILHMDMFDMSEHGLTLSGFQYGTLFSVVKSRYAMLFLHKTKDELPQLVLKAFARLGRNPRILRGDGAKEYKSTKLDQICLDRNVEQQWSNSHQQFQNGPSETLVNSLCKGVRVQLTTANLPGGFWGYAAINWLDCYNSLPHTTLGNKSPWEAEKGVCPDVSWHKPFGCYCTVYIGDDRNIRWHAKLAPRGVPCIYVGLGFSRGHKGWVCYDPLAQEVYCSRNVVFDETFFPVRTHDQRFLGHYDSTPRTRMIAQLHGSMEAAEQNQQNLNNMASSRLLDAIDSASPEELEDIQQPPFGRESHDEADPNIKDTGVEEG